MTLCFSNSQGTGERNIVKCIYAFSPNELYIPGTQMTSIFEGQPPLNKAELRIKTRVIWVPGHLYSKFEVKCLFVARQKRHLRVFVDVPLI